MSGEENLRILPTDLIIQIFSRLPSKSIARFRCLSKLWASLLTIGSPYFTELFLTHSKTRPHLLFLVRRNINEWCLYSCPQPQISDKNPESSLSVTAEFHMSLHESWATEMPHPILGLLYSPNSEVLCNPSTRHFFRLPHLTHLIRSYFGYDPIDKQFNLLAINETLPSYRSLSLSYQILKLGSRRLSWRSLDCQLSHYPFTTHICINGSLYYMAYLLLNLTHKIVCFNLNSEEFKFIDQPCDPHLLEVLVNFKGKLGGIKSKWVESSEKGCYLELSLWVLEDIEKQEWSKHVYDILQTKLWNEKGENPYFIVGMTAARDIVLALRYTTNPYYVYFFNPEKKTLRKVKINGLEEFKNREVFGSVDYVEELRALRWS